MGKKQIHILSYEDLLSKIKGEKNNLLLGNGFNRGLGVNTSYQAIFEKMLENQKDLYAEIGNLVKVKNYDLEAVIGHLQNDINEENTFLQRYVSNKVKYDFMKATHEIVKNEIKTIYAESNEGIYILLEQFDNYFTLNYDPFLYLLLLNYKSIDTDNNISISFNNNIKFIEKDMNETQNNIFEEIKEARDKGSLDIVLASDKAINRQMNSLSKTTFSIAIKEYSKSNNKKWKTTDIDKVVNKIWEEEKKKAVLKNINDGSKQMNLFNEKEFIFDTSSQLQNLFFLHGAFHIYQDNKSIKKITQKTDKALYDRLENIINDENQKIVCVFENNNKLDVIKQNPYLLNCYNKLTSLTGNIVILGCSLSDNDSHIFEAITKSNVKNIYVSTRYQSKEKTYQNAQIYFPNKNIFLYDAETISYQSLVVDQ